MQLTKFRLSNSNITTKELQLITQIILLLEPFFSAKEFTGLPQGQEKSGNQEKLGKNKKNDKSQEKSGKNEGY